MGYKLTHSLNSEKHVCVESFDGWVFFLRVLRMYGEERYIVVLWATMLKRWSFIVCILVLSSCGYKEGPQEAVSTEFEEVTQELKSAERNLAQNVINLSSSGVLDLSSYSEAELEFLIFSLKKYIKKAQKVFKIHKEQGRRPAWKDETVTRRKLMRSYRYIGTAKTLLLEREEFKSESTQLQKKIHNFQNQELSSGFEQVERAKAKVLDSNARLLKWYIYLDEPSYVSSFVLNFANKQTRRSIHKELKVFIARVRELDQAEQNLLGPMKLYIMSSKPEHYQSYREIVSQMRAQEFLKWTQVAVSYLRQIKIN